MTEPSRDLEACVEALESRVDEPSGELRHTRQDAAAARVLAGGANRDVGELRGELRDFRQATVASFNATREDIVDGFARVDEAFSEVGRRLDITAAGLAHITDLLTGQIAERGEDGPAG